MQLNIIMLVKGCIGEGGGDWLFDRLELLSKVTPVAILGLTTEFPTTHKQSSYICSILLCLGMHHILYSEKLI